MSDLVSWKEDLAKAAKEVTKIERTSDAGQKISFKGGRITYGDRMVDSLECIVVAYVVEKAYFDTPYDSEVFHPPRCFALAEEEAGIVPHANVPDPVNSACATCELAKFGTAERGKGPACKTRRRLALMPVPQDGQTPQEAELAWCSVPPTSVKNWSKYATEIGHRGLPPWAVSTEISCAPGKFMFDVKFRFIADHSGNSELMAGVHSRIPQATDLIMQPYTYEDAADKNANY